MRTYEQVTQAIRADAPSRVDRHGASEWRKLGQVAERAELKARRIPS